MTVYLFIFAILGLIAILMELRLTRSARLALFCLAYLILVLFVGLRWETGNDWANYYDYYRHLTSLRDQSGDFEIGYRTTSLVIKLLGLPYTGFLLLYSSAYIGLIFLSFLDAGLEMTGWLILALYSTYILGMMGTPRQAMAMAICLFGVRYVLAGKLGKFLLCVAIAATFHTSALCFLLTWFLGRVRLKMRYVWIALAGLVFALILGAGPALLESFTGFTRDVVFLEKVAALNADPYTNHVNSTAGDPAIRLYVKQTIFLVLFICGARYLKTDREQLYFKLYLVSFAILVILYGVNDVIAMRLSDYFSIFDIFILALFTRRIKTGAIRQVYCVMLFLLLLHGIWAGVNSTKPIIFSPYKGIFINQDVRRDPGWF